MNPTAVSYNTTKLAAGRLRAADRYPYFSSVLFALVPVPSPEIGTWAIDRHWRMFFDPRTLDTWTVDQIEFAWVHEANHALREHRDRAQAQHVNRDTHTLWNRATDAEINDDLLGDGLIPPFEVEHPGRYGFPDGTPAEVIYQHLLDADDEIEQSAAGSGAADGDSTPDGSPSPGNDESATPPSPGDDPGGAGDDPSDGDTDTGGDGEIRGGQAGFDCGSGTDGIPRPWDLSAEDPSKGQLPKVDPAEQGIIRQRVAEDIIEHAKTRGTVPGSLTRWAQATLTPPQLPWRQILRSHVRGGVADAAGKVNYSWARPSRRRVPKVVLPSLRAPTPRVAIVVDTSGSMGQSELDAAWTEVTGCLKSIGARREHLAVWSCDAHAERVKNLHGEMPHLFGGGGTDMGVGISRALEGPQRTRPDVVVVLTDGWTPWPDTPPRDARIVVGLLDPNCPPPPGYAKSVHIDLDES